MHHKCTQLRILNEKFRRFAIQQYIDMAATEKSSQNHSTA